MKFMRSAPAVSSSCFAACLLAVAASTPAPAAAETLTCTDITVLPYTIAGPGHYCLHKNFSQSFSASSAITVNASNVVIDCNDHYVHNSNGGFAGVSVYNRQQVTVRNCGFSNFGHGIAFYETVANASRNNLVTGNRVVRSRLSGIQMAGSANVVENNRISDSIGGSSNFTYGILVSSLETGVDSVPNGVANVVRNNTITQVAPALYVGVVGIYLLNVNNTAVLGNTISGLFPPTAMTAFGIVASTTSLGNAAIGNTVLAVTGSPPGGGNGINYTGTKPNGILFEADHDTINRNVCRGNVVGHWTNNIQVETGTTGCVKDGNTEF